jgi:hypothetical protein
VRTAARAEPGRLGLSDFSDARELGAHIGGMLFEYLLCQFALAYSCSRHVSVVLGDECFLGLSASKR